VRSQPASPAALRQAANTPQGKKYRLLVTGMNDKTTKTVDTDSSAAYRLATNPFQWSEIREEGNTCKAFPTTCRNRAKR
jgi:hypothetical protein